MVVSVIKNGEEPLEERFKVKEWLKNVIVRWNDEKETD
jgi:hypothetical protein